MVTAAEDVPALARRVGGCTARTMLSWGQIRCRGPSVVRARSRHRISSVPEIGAAFDNNTFTCGILVVGTYNITTILITCKIICTTVTKYLVQSISPSSSPRLSGVDTWSGSFRLLDGTSSPVPIFSNVLLRGSFEA